MISSNEHEKILEQVSELESNSIDYFDVEKEFFLIDSDNLSQVRPRLYGYSIQATGIYKDDNLTPEAIAGLDGRGAYVYVGVNSGEITIKQDLNGCCGIYLFRHGDYFAVSNSFFRLLDHIKFKYPLTLNRDYCLAFLVMDTASWAFATAVNEIQVVARDVTLHINKAKKTLEEELVDYKENSLSLDSAEGMATLDRWVELWGSILRGIVQHTKFFKTSLSGGFDTRTSFVLLLNSGIDLNKIRIHSINDEFHTHKEDYAIASQIAAHYGFELNRPLPNYQFLSYSLRDAINFGLNTGFTFSHISKFYHQKRVDILYALEGHAGETIRQIYFNESAGKFIDYEKMGSPSYYPALSPESSRAIKNILKSGFRRIRNKYNIEDEESPIIIQLLYREERARNHFGKDIFCNGLMNNLLLAPAMDPIVRTLKLNTSECDDRKLLLAVLYARYAPYLLTVPFDSKNSIAPETIEYAKQINERFPRRVTTDKVDGGGGGLSFIAA